MKRRRFIKVSGISLLASQAVLSLKAAHNQSTANHIVETSRKIPVTGQYDVIVCGAGPSGVAVALEAAKKGVSVLLVELAGSLGGTWTSGLLSWIIDHNNKAGFIKQLIGDLKERGAVSLIPTGGSLSFDIEQMKLLLENYCLDAGVNVRLHTRVVGVKKEKNRLTHILTESASGREAWSAKIFIDATGNGDLAALAGCGYDYGAPDNNIAQPCTLLALVGGVNFEDIKEYVRWEEDRGQKSKRRLYDQIKSGGYTPSYRHPGLYPIRNDLYMFMVNHEYECKCFDADNVTRLTLQARREINRAVDALAKSGDKWKNLKLIATPEQIGMREGRRIHGLYTVTLQDAFEGKNHHDAVCRVTFGIDVHAITAKYEQQEEGDHSYGGHKSQPYDIPLRALIAKDVQGLMMAGRCISGDFIAHSSYRVTGNAVPIGEAAGKVAAFSVLNDKLPQDVPVMVFQ